VNQLIRSGVFIFGGAGNFHHVHRHAQDTASTLDELQHRNTMFAMADRQKHHGASRKVLMNVRLLVQNFFGATIFALYFRTRNDEHV